MLTDKWLVMDEGGETSGGVFKSREAAEEHLRSGLRRFPGIAQSFRVARMEEKEAPTDADG
jgi:hypothetical protein